MSSSSLPEQFVRKLNRLGFVLVEGEQPYMLIRLATGGEMRLLVQASSSDCWRVGLATRAGDKPGHLPNPVLPVSLENFGPSPDRFTLEVSTVELCDSVPRLVRDSLLRMVMSLPRSNEQAG